MDHETILSPLDRARCQLIELIRDGLQTIGFLDPQLTGTGDDGIALSKKSGNGNNRNLINKPWHDLRSKGYSMQRSIADTDIGCSLAATRAFINQLNVCPHVLQYIEYTRTGRIDPHIAKQ